MKMLVTILALSIIGFSPVAAVAQEQTTIPTVSVDAKGDDVRNVLHQLFTQAKKNYVLDPGVRFALYLSLSDIEFDEAFQLICKNAGLTFEIQNGIYFIKRAPVAQPKVEEKPKGKLPETVLTRPVTMRSERVELKAILAEFTRQTQVPFELDPAVPAYRLDAILNKISLKEALTHICDAAKLEFVFTEKQTLLIRRKGEENRVVLREG